MLGDILGLPDHLHDALWRIESARLEAGGDAAGLIVCGMGGSAIGGDLAAAALGGRVTRPLMTVRGYALPSWVTPEWTVLCSSYSGDTEETLACFEAAGALGARRIVVSTGGELAEQARAVQVPVVGLPGILQPRAAVAYMFATAAEIAALCSVAPSVRTEIEAAAGFLEERRGELQRRAAEIASQLDGTLPVFYGADLTAPVAHRWKTQVNENAKLPAFFSDLPEADHNEICGWAGAPATGARLSVLMIEDADQHPRVRRRFELTGETIAADGVEVIGVETEGEGRVARMLWATMLGDLVSLELAGARGVDPMRVEAIEAFKAALSRT